MANMPSLSNGYFPTVPVKTATPGGLSASQVAQNATAFKQANWYNGGTTATPSTGSQNLVSVLQQPGNSQINNPVNQPLMVQQQNNPSTAGSTGVAASTAAAGNTAAPTTVNTPAFDPAAIAAGRVAAGRRTLASSVAAYDASRKNTFDYDAKNTLDSRTLRDAMFHETNDPFAGKYAYDKTNTARNDGIADTQSQTQYNNDISANDQRLVDYDAGSQQQQDDIMTQLQHQNLTDNIAQAGVTGIYNGNPTLTAQQDTITNNRNAATDTYNQGQDTIKNNQSDRTYNLDYQKQMADLTGFISDGKGGYVPTSTQQKQDLTDAWTATTNLGSVTPALSKLTGIPVGTPTEKAKTDAIQNRISQQNANSSSQNASTSAKNADTAVTNSTNSQNNANADNTRADGAAAAKTYQDTFSNLQSLYTAKDPNTGSIAVTNPQQLRAAILAKNFDDQTTIKMLTDFGLPIHP